MEEFVIPAENLPALDDAERALIAKMPLQPPGEKNVKKYTL